MQARDGSQLATNKSPWGVLWDDQHLPVSCLSCRWAHAEEVGVLREGEARRRGEGRLPFTSLHLSVARAKRSAFSLRLVLEVLTYWLPPSRDVSVVNLLLTRIVGFTTYPKPFFLISSITMVRSLAQWTKTLSFPARISPNKHQSAVIKCDDEFTTIKAPSSDVRILTNLLTIILFNFFFFFFLWICHILFWKFYNLTIYGLIGNLFYFIYATKIFILYREYSNQ